MGWVCLPILCFCGCTNIQRGRYGIEHTASTNAKCDIYSCSLGSWIRFSFRGICWNNWTTENDFCHSNKTCWRHRLIGHNFIMMILRLSLNMMVSSSFSSGWQKNVPPVSPGFNFGTIVSWDGGFRCFRDLVVKARDLAQTSASRITQKCVLK